MQSSNKPIVVCLTPVKNEAWILERFIKCASLWADHIIIADQGSTDGSQDIARQFEKVTLIENKNQKYDEYDRQMLLINKAREKEGPKLLIAIDADEIFTANLMESPEWQTMLSAKPGTVFRFNWVHPLPDMENYVLDGFDYLMGFMDDGSDLITEHALHNPRLPIPDKAEHIFMKDIKLFHFNFVDLQRDRSKKRWYMCWDKIASNRSDIALNRKYTEKVQFKNQKPIPREWFEAYEKAGIDMTSNMRTIEQFEVKNQSRKNFWLEVDYWWDYEVLEFFKEHGTAKFAGLDIWEKDWNGMAKRAWPNEQHDFSNPRGLMHKLKSRWVQKTQDKRGKRWVQMIDKVLS